MMIKMIKSQQILFNFNSATNTVLKRSFGQSNSLLQNAESKKMNNTSLYKLRKSTGYALSKCREALEKHNGNIDEVFIHLNFIHF